MDNNKKVDFDGDLEVGQDAERRFAKILEQTEELLEPVEFAV